MSVHPTATVHPEAWVAPSASVEAFATVERYVIISHEAFIGAGATLKMNSRVGRRSIVRPGAVLPSGYWLNDETVWENTQ
jgi:UDP-3-O-[3-hydroxymyristoyl] glucosamine N-acyltransferase